MINNISNVDTRLQQPSVTKTTASRISVSTPPIIGFKTPVVKEKAVLKVKKFRRAENIVIVGEIDEEYVDIIEDDDNSNLIQQNNFNFFQLNPQKKKTKFLKNCYVIDYIQSPSPRKGLGTEAIKGLAEKAMFDPKAEGRIVTFSSPVWKESSPAQFFYKLGFRFIDPAANEYINQCIINKIPDLPAQIGMMYLPKKNIHKLLRYGDVF